MINLIRYQNKIVCITAGDGRLQKGRIMEKSIDERLFELLMRAPHVIRRSMMSEGAEGRPCGPGAGRGRMMGQGFGPGFGQGREPGFGPGRAPGFGPGLGPGRGPESGGGRTPQFGPGRFPGRRPMFARERLLRELASFEGGVRQKELLETVKVNPSSMSEMISKLEHDGYVKRIVDPSDKRATLISLTELGEARAAELSDERNERFSGLFAKLSTEEKEQLLAILEKLTAKDE